METNQQRQGKPVESLRWMQVHSRASSTASAPTDTLFVGRAVSVVTRPPACRKLLETEGDTHTHTHRSYRLTHQHGPPDHLDDPFILYQAYKYTKPLKLPSLSAMFVSNSTQGRACRDKLIIYTPHDYKLHLTA